jgi:hypothetical protein
MFNRPHERIKQLDQPISDRRKSFIAEEYQIAKRAQQAEEKAREAAESRLPSDEQLYNDFAPNMTATITDLDALGFSAFDDEEGEPGMLAKSGNSVRGRGAWTGGKDKGKDYE